MFSTVGGIDFLFAAVHEFGHSLGLGHSDVRNSIMAPVYRGHVPDLQLKNDDIRAIQVNDEICVRDQNFSVILVFVYSFTPANTSVL